MKKAVTNVGASVQARLLKLARTRKEDFQLLLVRYANERFLYRLSKSPHADAFVLKGATLFSIWTTQPHRATRDVDLLGFGEPSTVRIHDLFKEVIGMDVGDDGVRFDAGSLMVAPIREHQEYGGVRAVLVAHLNAARVRLQVDVGFGDAIIPAAKTVMLPTLLDFPSPRLRAYQRETVVAEKLQAMVNLGLVNSRMKDFYDLAILSRMFEFEGGVLVQALRATFKRRGTSIPKGMPVGLTTAFTDDTAKRVQWRAFQKKSHASDLGDLPAVAAEVAAFVEQPLSTAAAPSARFKALWTPGIGWRTS